MKPFVNTPFHDIVTDLLRIAYQLSIKIIPVLNGWLIPFCGGFALGSTLYSSASNSFSHRASISEVNLEANV